MKDEIKHLFEPLTTVEASLVLFRYVSIVIGAFLLAEGLRHPVATVAAAILITVGFKGFNNIVHECSHNAFSLERRYNVWVGKAFCIPLFMDFESYRTEHASHHQHLGNYQLDIDFKVRQSLGHDRPFALRRILLDIVTLRFAWFYWPRLNLGIRDHWIGVVLYATVSGELFLAGAYSALWALALAQLLFLPLLRYLIDIVDHGGLYVMGVDEMYKSRNFIVRNPVFRGIFFPRNDCYHLVHHLFPYLPVHNLGKAHTVLMKDAAYASLPHSASLSNFLRSTSKIPTESVIRVEY